MISLFINTMLVKENYNTSSVYCRELAPGTVNLTGDWVRGEDSKQISDYTWMFVGNEVY